MISSLDAEALTRLLEGGVSVPDDAVGVQLSVAVGGQQCDVAVGMTGDGRPLLPSHQARVFCSGKPIVATAFIQWCMANEVSLSADLAEVAPGVARRLPEHCSGYRIVDLLRHQTPLILPKGLEMSMLPPGAIELVVRHEVEHASPGVLGYSEIAAWHILDWIVNEHGYELWQLVSEATGALGLDHTFFGGEVPSPDRPHVRVGAMWADDRWLPMLSDAVPEFLEAFDPAVGAYSNAGDLARYWNQVGEAIAEDSTVGLPGILAAQARQRRGPTFDSGLDRICDFGLGVMVNLSQHWDGVQLSSRSIGHSGYLGTSFGFHDPDLGVSVGCIVLGIKDGVAAIRRARPRLIGSITGLAALRP